MMTDKPNVLHDLQFRTFVSKWQSCWGW